MTAGLDLPRDTQLNGVDQRVTRAQIADDYQIVAWRSQICLPQIFFRRFDGCARIIGKFDSHRTYSPAKRELASHFLTWREGKNGGVFRAQIGSVAPHRSVSGENDDFCTRQ